MKKLTLVMVLVLLGCGCGKDQLQVKATPIHCGYAIAVYSNETIDPKSGPFEKVCVKGTKDWEGTYRVTGTSCGFYGTADVTGNLITRTPDMNFDNSTYETCN